VPKSGKAIQDRPTKSDLEAFNFLKGSFEKKGDIYVPVNEADFNIYKDVKSAIKASGVVAPDLTVNDRDFPKAPNFYQFCISDKFLNTKPYLMQALIGIQVFAEWCPRCSDVQWVIHDHKVDDSLAKLERKVALLENGVCPHCKATKSKLVAKGLLKPYQEEAISAGQRSGKSALVADQASYLTHRVLMLQNPNKVYDLKASTMLHGTFVALTFQQAKDNLWDPFYGNIADSPWFCIAEDTLIALADGSTKVIQGIQVGDEVKTIEGQEKVLEVYDNGFKECKEATLSNGSSITGTDDHLVHCLGPDGESIVWKRIKDLTEEDYVVTL
jgi:hypothetical protein